MQKRTLQKTDTEEKIVYFTSSPEAFLLRSISSRPGLSSVLWTALNDSTPSSDPNVAPPPDPAKSIVPIVDTAADYSAG